MKIVIPFIPLLIILFCVFGPIAGAAAIANDCCYRNCFAKVLMFLVLAPIGVAIGGALALPIAILTSIPYMIADIYWINKLSKRLYSIK
jgi:hypothetical protein